MEKRKTVDEILQAPIFDQKIVPEWIDSSTSIPELNEFITKTANNTVRHNHDLARDKRQQLHYEETHKQLLALQKPHKLFWWTFWVGVATLIVCLVGYWNQFVGTSQWFKSLFK